MAWIRYAQVKSRKIPLRLSHHGIPYPEDREDAFHFPCLLLYRPKSDPVKQMPSFGPEIL